MPGTQSELLDSELIARVERVKNQAVLLLEALYGCYPDLRFNTGEAKGDWNEADHPRDERGRFSDGWLSAARGQHGHHPDFSLQGEAAFWEGGGPGGAASHRDALTRQHFNGKFEVDIPANERATLDHLSHLMFGRALEPREWGELIGAPDGEKLEARALPLGVLVQIRPDTPSPRYPFAVLYFPNARSCAWRSQRK
jgi:hypothetical protein